jgi:DNA invertase Pin-like site-specific DNA recombinase
MILAIVGEMGRAERETLSKRIKSGMDAARKAGRRMGRPKGSTLSDAQLVARHGDIARQLRAGLSIRKVAKLTDKSAPTVLAVKRALERVAR